MRYFLLIAFCLLTVSLFGQKSEDYKYNQHQIDKNHSGIGFQFFKPNFGKGTATESNWFGVNVLADYFEFKMAFGKTYRVQQLDYFDPSYQMQTPAPGQYESMDYGYQIAIGANAPINVLTFGSYQSVSKVLRGHPVFGANLGLYGIKQQYVYYHKNWENIYFLGLSPGYRIRLPYASIEFKMDFNFGITVGDVGDYYRGISYYPSITLRADALKQLFAPEMISVPYQQGTISNYNSSSYSIESRTPDGGKVVTTYTTTTADVSVSSGTVGVQDIGPHIGVGPKISWTSVARSDYLNPGRLYGAVLQGRGGPIDFGFTMEGGRVGHGTTLEAKSEEGKYRRKLDRKDDEGMGDVSLFNTYFNVGMDISPLFLAPLGVAMDKGSATSFFSASAGMLFGGHFTFNQEFNDPTVSNAYYDAELLNKPEGAKDRFIDPRAAKSGLMFGFYFSLQVGAMNFMIQNNRYNGAPFASSTMMSLAYRYPLGR